MRTINRRELNQHSGRIVDEVLATGEPIEVVSHGGESVVISRRAASRFDEWIRMGLAKPATGRLDHAPQATSPRTVEEMLESVASDH